MRIVVENQVLVNVEVDYEKDSCIKEFAVPSGVKKLASGSLAYLPLEIESLYIPASVEEIPSSALFSQGGNYENLKTIVVENGNKNYKSQTGCLIDLRENSVILGAENAIIPDGIEKIEFYAFREREKLTEITIPQSVKVVDRQAFACCRNLKKVTILGAETNIDNLCFISDVNIEEFNLPKNSDYEFVNGCLVKKPCETLLMITDSGIIPENIVRIETLSCVRYFKDLLIPKTVVGFGESAILLLGGGKVKVKKDSKAFEYVQKNDIRYEEI